MDINFNPDKKTLPGDLPDEIKAEQKYMSKIFFIFIGAYVISLVAVLMTDAFLYAFTLPSDTLYIIRSILSAIHTPLIFFIMLASYRHIPAAKHPVIDKITPVSFLKILSVCIFIMVAGSVLGTYISELIGGLTGTKLENSVSDMIKDMPMAEVFILAVVLAPIFEELIFRKLLVDKLSQYGTAFAMVVSGLVFGLYHGNFHQFFYAFGVGIILAYVYCIYGKISCTIILHAIINAIGSVVPLALDIGSSTHVTDSQVIYMYLYIFAFLTGGFVLLMNFKAALFNMIQGKLIKPYRVLFANPGFISTVVISFIIFFVNMYN